MATDDVEKLTALLSRLEKSSNDSGRRKTVVATASRLRLMHERFSQGTQSKIGDIVVWKDGLKNRKLPLYNEPAIVVQIVDPPVFDAEQDAGTSAFREPLSVILGVVTSDGDFACYHFDGRRFELADNASNVIDS